MNPPPSGDGGLQFELRVIFSSQSLCAIHDRGMRVPELLCGDTKTVTAACRKHIARFKKGGSWVDAGELVDIRNAPGLVMIESPLYGVGPVNIRLYAPFWQLEKSAGGGVTLESSTRAFDEALDSAWSALGLLSPIAYRWLQDRERSGRYLAAMMAHWAEFEEAGPRYVMSSHRPQTLWELPLLLKAVLASRGVPKARLIEPLPPGGIAALLPASN